MILYYIVLYSLAAGPSQIGQMAEHADLCVRVLRDTSVLKMCFDVLIHAIIIIITVISVNTIAIITIITGLVHVCLCMCVYVCTYIYIYIERERDR